LNMAVLDVRRLSALNTDILLVIRVLRVGLLCVVVYFFFFQAEDGIRDDLVTGVQTCALPISPSEVTTISTGFPDCTAFRRGWRCRVNWRNVIRISPITRQAACQASNRTVFRVASLGVKVSGHESPVKQTGPTLYLECHLNTGAVLSLPDNYDEIAAYVVLGELRIGQTVVSEGLMVVAAAGETMRLEATCDSHVMIVGGAKFGKRHLWWNYVSSSQQRIEQAKQDWRENRFDAVPGETEFIPLPDS